MSNDDIDGIDGDFGDDEAGAKAPDPILDYEGESPVSKLFGDKNAQLALGSFAAIGLVVGGYMYFSSSKADMLANPASVDMMAPTVAIAPGSVPSGQSPLAMAAAKKSLPNALPIPMPAAAPVVKVAPITPTPAVVKKAPDGKQGDATLSELMEVDGDENIAAKSPADSLLMTEQEIKAAAKAEEDKKAKELEQQLAAEKIKAAKAEESLLDSEIMESELLDNEVKAEKAKEMAAKAAEEKAIAEAKMAEEKLAQAKAEEEKKLAAADKKTDEEMLLDEMVGTEVAEVTAKKPLGADEQKKAAMAQDTVLIDADGSKSVAKLDNSVDLADPADAELAIIQNSTVLDTLPPPSQVPVDPREKLLGDMADTPAIGSEGQTVDDILSQSASVRPLPKGYITIKKERDSNDLDSQIITARTALAQGRYVASLELFNDLYKIYPEHPNILMGRAVSMQKLGQSSDALNAYEEVLSYDPGNLEALTNMLGILKTQDAQTALTNLIQLRELYPYNADITAQLGMLYGQTGDFRNAVKYLDMAEALKPNDLNIMYNKAVAYDRMGKARQAAEIYRTIVYRASSEEMDRTFPIEAIKKRLAFIR